jgi:hypothetical protein
MRTVRPVPSASREELAVATVGRRLLYTGCVAFAALAVGSWLLLAAAHAGDAYGVDHVAGTWLALAQRLGEGTLYPPLYDGESFGGTRYMPIPIVLHGGLGLLLGDYLVAGKLIAYVLMAALVVVVVLVLRRERCPFPVAALCAATLLVTGAGLTAGTWIRHDTLPVILQLVAVALVAGSTSRKTLVGAAALCALALAAKLSAIWAPLAIGLWLLVRERSRLATFAAAYLGLAVVILGIFEAITRGRLTDNVVELGFSGARGFESFDWEQARLRLIFGEGLGPVRLLVALALLLVAPAVWRRRLTLFELSLVVSLAVLAVVLADRGTNSNQLLDLQVLSVIVLGAAWTSLRPLLRTGLVLSVLATGIAGYIQNVEPAEAARALVDEDSSRLPEVARSLGPNMQLLSENPYVPISLGQRPVVLDAFMLWNIARRHPEARQDLERRLDAREFDAIVLFYRPEDRSASPGVRFWFETEHFGSEIVDAIERNYRASMPVGDLWIYEPRPES